MGFEVLDLDIIARTIFLSISFDILILYVSRCFWSRFASFLRRWLFLYLCYSLLGKYLFLWVSGYSLILPAEIFCIFLCISFIFMRSYTQLYLFSRTFVIILIFLRNHNICTIPGYMAYFSLLTLLRYFIVLMYCFRI